MPLTFPIVGQDSSPAAGVHAGLLVLGWLISRTAVGPINDLTAAVDAIDPTS